MPFHKIIFQYKPKNGTFTAFFVNKSNRRCAKKEVKPMKNSHFWFCSSFFLHFYGIIWGKKSEYRNIFKKIVEKFTRLLDKQNTLCYNFV